MGYAYVTVTDQSGAIDLVYAEMTWSGSSGSTTVYVTIEGVRAAGGSWRIKKGNSVLCQGTGIGDYTFTGTIGETYQVQGVDPNTSNWAWYGGNFTLDADSSGDDDDWGDDDDDTGGGSSGGGSSGGGSSSGTLWIKGDTGIKVLVYKWNSSRQDYILVPDSNFTTSSDSDGLWYSLAISFGDYFRFGFQATKKCTVSDFGIYNLTYYNDDRDWYYSGDYEPYVWPTVTVNSSVTDLPNH